MTIIAESIVTGMPGTGTVAESLKVKTKASRQRREREKESNNYKSGELLKPQTRPHLLILPKSFYSLRKGAFSFKSPWYKARKVMTFEIFQVRIIKEQLYLIFLNI